VERGELTAACDTTVLQQRRRLRHRRGQVFIDARPNSRRIAKTLIQAGLRRFPEAGHAAQRVRCVPR